MWRRADSLLPMIPVLYDVTIERCNGGARQIAGAWNGLLEEHPMAVWAYECRAGGANAPIWFVSSADVDALPAGVRNVLVKVGAQWLPAQVDRTRPVSVEGMLVREVIADDNSG